MVPPTHLHCRSSTRCLCIDFVWAVSAIVIADTFPANDQGLAGAAFNTIGNLGQALGLALIAVAMNAVTQAHDNASVAGAGAEARAAAELAGYKAGYWTVVGSMLLTAVVGGWGLRSTGTVGIKRD